MISKNMIPEIMNKINNIVSNEVSILFNEISNLENGLKIEKENNKKLLDTVLELEKKNADLSEKIKNKSTSAIWESMQGQLQEKDKQMEQIKKELDFYKRQYNVKNPETICVNNLVTGIFGKNNKDTKDIVEVVKEVKEEVKVEVEEVEVEEDKPKKKKKSKSKKMIKIDENNNLDNMDDLERELMNN